MRALIQRVSQASVIINGVDEGRAIRVGLLVLLGIGEDDNQSDAEWLAGKIASLRIFSDEVGLMNLDVKQVNGSLLVVSQFTLHALTKKGNRPSFIKAAKPDQAIPLYDHFINSLKLESKCDVLTGEFGADMKIHLVNDGPVTIWIDTQNKE